MDGGLINVDRIVSEGVQDYESNDEEEREGIMGWSQEKRKPKRKKRRKIVRRAELWSHVLGSCSVIIIATLSGAGSKAFVDAVCRDPTKKRFRV